MCVATMCVIWRRKRWSWVVVVVVVEVGKAAEVEKHKLSRNFARRRLR